MKKTGFLLLLTTLCSAGFSQVARIGFAGGISANRGSYTPEEGLDRRIIGGFDGGLLVEFNVCRRLMIQPEMNYTITGVELNDGNSERSIKLQYISLPVLAKINIVKGLSVVAGPQHSILLSAWNDPSGEVSSRIKELFKFTDLVLVGGLEYKCRNNLFLTLRYNHGMEQIAEEGMGFEMKNRYLGFRVGYIF